MRALNLALADESGAPSDPSPECTVRGVLSLEDATELMGRLDSTRDGKACWKVGPVFLAQKRRKFRYCREPPYFRVGVKVFARVSVALFLSCSLLEQRPPLNSFAVHCVRFTSQESTLDGQPNQASVTFTGSRTYAR